MRLEFVTDESVTDRGWKANYWVRECGGVQSEDYGLVASPTHPANYHHMANCTWYINVTDNKIIELK